MLNSKVLSGSTPEGDEAFAALARLGVKTIISVDGAKPDVEAARRHGMRYVHLPHGYDGINDPFKLQLVKAGEVFQSAGPMYVHCHHGKHRGPTAAAIMCQGNNGWTGTEAEAWLKVAGTATNYTGLFEAVRSFRVPQASLLNTISTNFPEIATVSGLVGAMVGIDAKWDHLKAVRAAGYQAPKDHPDLKPAKEAVILWEHFRESQRFPESVKLGTNFMRRLKSSETDAREAEALLQQFATNPSAEVKSRLDERFDAIAASCSSCHKAFRDSVTTKTR